MRIWSIGKKLFTATAVLALLVIALGTVAIVSLGKVQGHMAFAAGEMSEKIQLADRLGASTQTLFLAEKTAILNAYTGNDELLKHWEETEVSTAAGMAELIEKSRALFKSAENQQRLTQVQSDLDGWVVSYHKVHELIDQGKVEDAQLLSVKENKPRYEEITKEAADMQARVMKEMGEARDDGAATYASAWWTILSVSAIAIAVSALLFWVTRGIIKTLRGSLHELRNGGAQVASASGQIASGSQTLSQGASDQAAAIQEISSSVEEMSAMTRRSGENASTAAAMMGEAASQVERSNAALAEMQSSMRLIKESSEKVARINKTIDEIAFQTNILALNAAVEAARAGEAGKGFAVVAEEVRNLAQRAAVAAKETAGLIEESIGNSNEGSRKLEQVALAIRGITDSANKVEQMIAEVNEASRQQVQGIQNVTTAITQVKAVTQTTAASAEESAAAAEELSAQAMTVRDLVNGLMRMADGSSAETQLTA